MKKRFSVLSLLIACFAGLVIAGTVAGVYFSTVFGGGEEFSAAKKFSEVYHIIDDRFVGEADMDGVTDAAYRAMVEATEDQWSYYMTAEEYEYYKEYQQNSYQGIGVSIEEDEDGGYLRVKIVAEDSPAQRAGITIGDRFIELNGQDLKGMTTSEVKVLIGETKGQEFELKLLSKDDEDRTVKVTAGLIFSDPVKYEMLDDGIGYIRIKNFESKSGSGAISALTELIDQGAQGIIFDVRGNPGGMLSELTNVLDHILPEGDLFVSVNQNGVESVISSDADSVDIPMVVLVDANSYSAAEFFAAALSEYGVAQLVGEPTTGKSRSQINIFLSDGAAVHLSTNGYLTPKRVDLAEQGGLTPDYVVQLSGDDADYFASGLLDLDDDAQFIKAVSVLLR